jgi:hypothetical protein
LEVQMDFRGGSAAQHTVTATKPACVGEYCRRAGNRTVG